MPRAIEYAGRVISVCYPAMQSAADTPEVDPAALRRTARHDARCGLCHRPAIVTGGEQRRDRLDLPCDPDARSFRAPLRLESTGGLSSSTIRGGKRIRRRRWSTGGFGRWRRAARSSRCTPAKLEVPFDTQVILSTNLHPASILDGAAHRRIFSEIRIVGPVQRGLRRLFAMVAETRKAPLDDPTLQHMPRNRSPRIDPASAYHQPALLIDQMVAIRDFAGIPRRMSPTLADRAWANLAVAEGDVAHRAAKIPSEEFSEIIWQ